VDISVHFMQPHFTWGGAHFHKRGMYQEAEGEGWIPVILALMTEDPWRAGANA
jgi:hypothetical protein